MSKPGPNCAKCGREMTPQNARDRPELFLHDACLPAELRVKRDHRGGLAVVSADLTLLEGINVDELATAIKAAHDAGYHGVAIWAQAKRGQGVLYVAAALNRDGVICEPRNWDAQASPAAALADLTAKLIAKDLER